jgi:hypothetical protein
MEPTTEEKKCCETKKGCCFCHKVPGLLIALIGVTILLTTFGVWSERGGWSVAGVLIIMLGLKKMCSGMCKCCDKS